MTAIRTWVEGHPLLAFCALTFGLAWSIWIPVGLFAPNLLLTVVLFGAWSPSLSAFFLTALLDGRSGVKELLGRVCRWRIHPVWYLITLFGMPVIMSAALGVNLALGGSWPSLNLPPGAPVEYWYVVLPILFMINVFLGGPLAEEFGWRGFALPRLSQRWGALRASLLIGSLWGLWHWPLAWFPEGRAVIGGVPIVGFVLLTTGWSVWLAWVFVNSRGSLLLPVLFHAAINTTLGSINALGYADGSGDLRLLIITIGLVWFSLGGIVIVSGPALARSAEPVQFN